MGKARIDISWEFMQTFMDLPRGWKPTAVWIEEHRDTYDVLPARYDLHLMVEGESIENSPDPLELHGVFDSKTFSDKDGRWVQGHWEVFR